MEPTSLESDILWWIAERVVDSPLTQQIATSRVTDRLVTPSGFYATLEPGWSEPVASPDGSSVWWIDGPFVTGEGLECGAVSILHIASGRVHLLEVVALAGGHPGELATWKLSALPDDEQMTSERSVGDKRRGMSAS